MFLTTRFSRKPITDAFTKEFVDSTSIDDTTFIDVITTSPTERDDESGPNVGLIVGLVLVILLVIGGIVALLLYIFKFRSKPYDESIHTRDEEGDQHHVYDNVKGRKSKPPTTQNVYTNFPQNQTPPENHGLSFITHSDDRVYLNESGTKETNTDDIDVGHFKDVPLDDEKNTNDAVYDNQSVTDSTFHKTSNVSDDSFYEEPQPSQGQTQQRRDNKDGDDDTIYDNESYTGETTSPLETNASDQQNSNRKELSQSEMIERVLSKCPKTPPVVPKRPDRGTSDENRKAPQKTESFYLDMEGTTGGLIAVETEEPSSTKNNTPETDSTVDSAQMDDTYEIQ